MTAPIQREMPFLESLQKAEWVSVSEVTGWNTYRDSVMWCWDNRKRNSRDSVGDQRVFASRYGCHAPHVSRWLNPRTKAPMDLPADLIPAFESFCGWRGVTQYLASKAFITPMEEVIARRAA
jgi:hypothetical protein